MSPETQDIPYTIQALVLSDTSEVADPLAAALSLEAGLVARAAGMAFGEGLKAVARYEPHVVVVTDTIDDPAAVVEALETAAPGTPSLVILPQGDLKGAQECSLAGARTTLLRPFEQRSLVEAIRQVYLKEVRRKQHVVASLEAGEARLQRPRIIAVHGAKGGVGATTLACNLAAGLRQVTGRRVALVDGDVLGGTAGVLFDLTSHRNLSDLLPHLKDLEGDLVNSLLVEHATGVRVLLAPEQLQRAETVGGDDMQRVLEGLKPYFDYQVVDTASRITPVTLAALDEADLILLVVTPEMAALRNAARFLQLATQLGYPADKVLLVANRADTGRDISPAVIGEYFKRPVAAALPSEGRALVDCQNAGELVAVARPGQRYSKDLMHLARDVAASFGWEPGVQQARVAAPQRGQTPSGDPTSATRPAGPTRGAESPVRRLAGRLLPALGRSAAHPTPALSLSAPLLDGGADAR
jgi:pilus assembly protein CpaE